MATVRNTRMDWVGIAGERYPAAPRVRGRGRGIAAWSGRFWSPLPRRVVRNPLDVPDYEVALAALDLPCRRADGVVDDDQLVADVDYPVDRDMHVRFEEARRDLDLLQ